MAILDLQDMEMPATVANTSNHSAKCDGHGGDCPGGSKLSLLLCSVLP